MIGVLRTFFYITDSQPLKSATVYYRKPVWRRMEIEATESLTCRMLQVLFARSMLWTCSVRFTGVCVHV